jgi:hypothetical protein
MTNVDRKWLVSPWKKRQPVDGVAGDAYFLRSRFRSDVQSGKEI